MNKHTRTALAAGLGLTALIAAGPQAAFAADPTGSDQASAEQVSDTVEALAVDEPGTTRVPVAASAGTVTTDAPITAKGDTLDIAIPSDASGQVTLSRPGDTAKTSFSVGLPTNSGNNDAVVASDGTVTYDSHVPSTDVAVQAFDHGVRVQTVLGGADAPHEFTYPVTVPAGGSISVSNDGGVLVTDADGLPHGGFAAPWAKDSTGADVPTHYEVRGNDVVQVIDHTNAAYPVVADPWLWIDLISSASWSYHAEGWTLMVAPTGWARANAGGYAVGAAGWNELYSKYKNRGLNRNLDGMRDQFICHQQIVALRAPRKPTWNLDEWRPNVGYLQTVNSQCNPGGAKWFD